MGTDADLAVEFDRHRTRLMSVAYRLTGRIADAEDAVQEAWLRLSSVDDPSGIRDLAAWLTTVVGRICVDRMRSAAARRERYVGPWLPEPIVTSPDSQDPSELVADREEIRLAVLRVLHELTPDQRFAFVLHDGFQVPFVEIADMLGCTTASARQHASRARRAMADGPPPPSALPEQQRVVEQLLAAFASGDISAVAHLLHPDVTLYGDSGGKARTARRPVVGIDKVTRFMQGLFRKYGELLYRGHRPVLVNGDFGFFLPGAENSPVDRRVFTAAVTDGQVVAVYDIVNPDKLTHLPHAVTAASGVD